MREICTSGSEGGRAQTNELSLPLSFRSLCNLDGLGPGEGYLREGSVFISPPPREMKLLVPPCPESLGAILAGRIHPTGWVNAARSLPAHFQKE